MAHRGQVLHLADRALGLGSGSSEDPVIITYWKIRNTGDTSDAFPNVSSMQEAGSERDWSPDIWLHEAKSTCSAEQMSVSATSLFLKGPGWDIFALSACWAESHAEKSNGVSHTALWAGSSWRQLLRSMGIAEKRFWALLARRPRCRLPPTDCT